MRIAGAGLASRPNWTVDALAQRLGDEVRRLDELRAGALQVGATFRPSYQRLAEATARALNERGGNDGEGSTGTVSASCCGRWAASTSR